MPQLAPNFWATNFVTIWLLLLMVTMTVTSLHLPTPPSSAPATGQLSSPQWPWA
uniref:ATP synthase complex subunit 8 n=1 Tax=Schizocardium brasiliense TaxID=1443243 RepID=A0A3Q8HNI6_9BILA|nr:ATP synthase F0 subunit 8 [Schizocardium brasiliense]AXY64142.1 ATP synthase F0 subunit 8 [Schizocardium brasiliense]